MDNAQAPDTFYSFYVTGLPALILILIGLAFVVVPVWKIWSRTGHAGAWGLLMLLPVVNILSLWVLAFKKWPAIDAGKTGLR